MQEDKISLDLHEIINATIDAKYNKLNQLEFHRRIVESGLSRSTIEEISRIKKEPEWMLKLRLKGLELFEKLPTPNWLPDVLSSLDISALELYVKPGVDKAQSWEELPPEIRKYYDELGIPESEKKFLGGLVAVLESEPIYSNVKVELMKKGVVMLPIDEAVNKYPDLMKEYFMKIFPASDHKFAALHGALWSGGVFVYVPKNVKITTPVEGFFVIGSELEGQFEHTLLIADEGSYIHFIEGCTAPQLKKYSFHDGMVELYAKKNAYIKFTTIQNWSKNVINFNNKRAWADENSTVEWVEGSLGSKYSFVYPSTILRGKNASSTSLVVTMTSGEGEWKDSGSKMIHAAPYTKSKVVNKNIGFNGGVNVYRGLIKVNKGAVGSKAFVKCDSLMLDDKTKAYTYPHNQVLEEDADVGHEAHTFRMNEDQLFYLMTRGIDEKEATSMLVLGFIDEIMKELPFEYATMLNKVIKLELDKLGAVA
ncbi:FeS assembly protein SufB [Sulfolobus islandicus Y.G.57.14]|jgi:Fe-S cluster assembly protein SufB|uniref:Iron-sulfur cluster assembly protein SufB n=11 Tax=Saccharolobus TaxID=2100760 RepID=A0A8F5C2Z5_9CREN|nr:MULTISPECIES: Fe-S cluster assembly protein SufB [Sulfolobaceae]ACP35391.1 FeS assembly protein SufB [Sulfolobus islandicus L.S.2.15]ACP38051.1 FeS assembly protein SufB [Sulfolobus islandicus M.14.25]ACP45557.1 FeS assembly protein SufB [Sulfolobus islandicus Y.G.57.14]ACP55229.1 FeS assembly protein SufB [Sulfolobus islandicus M.16.27]ACR41884.1 FeS assembly protein SufB [Sulfolobus islandicus M.16.4]